MYICLGLVAEGAFISGGNVAAKSIIVSEVPPLMSEPRKFARPHGEVTSNGISERVLRPKGDGNIIKLISV